MSKNSINNLPFIFGVGSVQLLHSITESIGMNVRELEGLVSKEVFRVFHNGGYIGERNEAALNKSIKEKNSIGEYVYGDNHYLECDRVPFKENPQDCYLNIRFADKKNYILLVEYGNYLIGEHAIQKSIYVKIEVDKGIVKGWKFYQQEKN